MRLQELEPQFRRFSANDDGRSVYEHVESLADAQGVLFLCPACFRMNGGPTGTHSVLVWFDGRGVPPEAMPSPRWRVSGSGYDDLTLAPSIFLQSGCRWHGFITAGQVIGA